MLKNAFDLVYNVNIYGNKPREIKLNYKKKLNECNASYLSIK